MRKKRGGRRDPAAFCLLRALSRLLGHLPERGRGMVFEGLYGGNCGNIEMKESEADLILTKDQ